MLYKWYNQPAASINFHRGGDGNTGFLSFSTESGGTLTERMRIDAKGNIGIGTISTGPYKLAVEGTLAARKIKVTSVTPWADFVFNDDYKLPDLPSLKNYIQANKHLPGIPTAAAVKAEGIDIAEINAKLLQKVEELTLLVIQQDEAIKALQAEQKKIKEKKE